MAVLDYALVGRWLAHMRHRRFRHASIAKTKLVRHEAAIGWTAHYAIGVAYGALLPALWGAGWTPCSTTPSSASASFTQGVL